MQSYESLGYDIDHRNLKESSFTVFFVSNNKYSELDSFDTLDIAQDFASDLDFEDYHSKDGIQGHYEVFETLNCEGVTVRQGSALYKSRESSIEEQVTSIFFDVYTAIGINADRSRFGSKA